MVSAVGRLPASPNPSRSAEQRDGEHEEQDGASDQRGHGRRCRRRLQRYQTEAPPPAARARWGRPSRSMLLPTNPRSAGSSVIEASIVVSTPIEMPTARPRIMARPMMNRPSTAMITVQPANSTARPAVSIARRRGVLRIQAVGQALPVAGDDEQGVVDADADADHGHGLDREAGHVDDVDDEADEGDAGEDAEDRGDQGQAHGQHRPEREQQDHHGGEEAERLTRELGLLGEDVAAELDLRPGTSGASTSATGVATHLGVPSLSRSPRFTSAYAMVPSALTWRAPAGP